ncbi:MAG: TPM domain-containing protein [Desulforhopalus sp.]|nr:TPM domain-containing protein [Desulforhopalus sp.]
MNLTDRFLSTADRQKISACVANIEKRTSGEVVVLVAPGSGHHPLSTLFASLLLSLPAALLLCMIPAHYYTIHLFPGVYLFLLCEGILLTLFYHLFASGIALPLLRLFLLPKEVAEEVRLGAQAAFFEHSLHRTTAANGVLLYISVLEQRTWILADEGIDTKVGRKEWKKIVNNLTATVGKGDNGEAICKAVTQIGLLLAQHFPPDKADGNELRDLIIE